MKTTQPINKQQGQVILIAVLFFLFISTTIVLGIATPILKQVRASLDSISSKESLYLAQGEMEDALYRIKTNKSIMSGETVMMNDYPITISLANNLNQKIITAEANRDGLVRKLQAAVVAGTGVSFNYGVQTGNGGVSLAGGSVIDGNIYSNGDISGDGGSEVTGTAIAANPIAVSIEQSNETPMPPTNSITFGNSNSSQDFAQSFQVSNIGPLTTIELFMKKNTSDTQSDVIVKIVSDSSGSPGSSVIASVTLYASQIGDSYSWASATFDTPPQLVPGTTYWFVVDRSTDSHKYFIVGANTNTSYPNGQAKVGRLGSSWTTANLDGYFRIKFGGGTSVIYGDGYDYLQVGADSWAHTVRSTNTAGTIYCQDIIGSTQNNGKPCNTSRQDPPAQPMPVSDANITTWKNDAAAGGVIPGNYNVGYAGAVLGPKKITGNLTITGGGTLTLTGTVWVQGTITITSGGNVRLSPSYGSNSGVLISDGRISVSGNGQFTGSGQQGSYPLLITTSVCPNDSSCAGAAALNITGGSGAVVLNAQNGTINMNGGSGARSITAYQLNVSGGGTVTYLTGLANINFTSGPSGGWDIASWKEIP